MLDEHDVIRLITSRFESLPAGYLPIGDDVASIPPGVVLKCDMLVAKTDVPPGMTWKMAARKAVAMCVSDFAAKGVRPTAFMVSLGLERGVQESNVEELASGFLEASKEWGVRLVGGDTSEAGDLIIDCLMVGFGKKVVRRGGARPGEYIVVSGPFGLTSAGLKILMGGAKARGGFRKEAVSSVYMPKPRLELGLSLAKYLSSSIDSSDGLAISLHTISEMSKVGLRLTDLPYAGGLEQFASANMYSIDELTLYGGEEYEIVATIEKQRLKEAKTRAKALGCELRVIGETVAIDEVAGVELPDGRKARREGWIHFRSGA